MSNVHLSIGTATDRISLIQPSLIGVFDWDPSETPLADTFSESSLGDGRILSSYREENAIEAFRLHIKGYEPDALIRLTQDIRRMLIMARDYWVTAWQGYPVYLQARGACETNFRYAVVYAGQLPSDTLPWGYGFAKANVMEDRDLVIERGPWLSVPPGTGSCIEIIGGQTRCFPYHLEFDGADDVINCHNDAKLQNLPDNAVFGKGMLTAEAWIRPSGWGENNSGRIFDKAAWVLHVDSVTGLEATVICNGGGQVAIAWTNEFTLTGDWVHVLMVYSETGILLPAARTIYLALSGTWVTAYGIQQPSIGTYGPDTTYDLYIGDRLASDRCFEGDIGWARVSNTIRYQPASGNFEPPDRCTIPDIDANTMGQWIQEGTGVVVANQAGGTDGDLTGAAWECDCPEEFGSDAESPPYVPPVTISDIGARAYNSGNLNANNLVSTVLTLDSERWDTDNIHSTVANTSRLTCRTAGVYLITGHIQWAAAGGNNRWIELLLDGATLIARHASEPAGAGASDQSIETLYELSVGQYVELRVLQDSGAGINVLATPNQSPELTMQLVGAPGANIGARVYNSGNLASGGGAWTTLTFDSERYDTDGIHSVVANTSRLTAQTAGKYAITGHVMFDDDGWNERGVRVLLNGTTVIAAHRNKAAGLFSGYCALSIGTLYRLGVGEYVELQVIETSGPGNPVILAWANESPEFAMQLIGEE